MAVEDAEASSRRSEDLPRRQYIRVRQGANRSCNDEIAQLIRCPS